MSLTTALTIQPPPCSGTNTATATWDKAAAFTPTGTASGAKAFTLSQLGSANKTVHVTDTFGGALGTVTATDSAPFAKHLYLQPDSRAWAVRARSTTTSPRSPRRVRQPRRLWTVCVGIDLTVEKTAAGTFDRTYLWQISKAVDKTMVNIANGGICDLQLHC